MKHRSKQLIDHVLSQSSNCTKCAGSCPCRLLAAYIKEVGQKRFAEEAESGALPDYVKSAYDAKISKLG